MKFSRKPFGSLQVYTGHRVPNIFQKNNLKQLTPYKL